MIPVIVTVGSGGRPLVRTADSVARQSGRASIALAVGGAGRDEPPLVRSVATRLSTTVHRGSNDAEAIAAAAAAAASEWFAIVPAGLTVSPDFVARCGEVFDDRADVAAVVPSVRLHSPDGQAAETWRAPSSALADALADPGTAPPVIALRRTIWNRLGGLDRHLPGLAQYDFWVRLCASQSPVVLLDDPLVSCDLSQPAAWPAGSSSDDDHLRAIRAVYEKHRHSLEREMAAVLVRREAGFVHLRDAHRELVRRRDAGMAELDRLRAEAAHDRAYVAHHGSGAVDWGDLRRTDPVSRDWGYDRGTPVDRRYIEQFLAGRSSDIRGAVLEVQEDDFTRRFGGPRVTASDVLDIDMSNPRATVHADLRCAPEIPPASYDCIILTQTLHVIDDADAVLRECARVLKPGGVLLATVPAASRVCLEYGEEGDLWRMTRAGALVLFERAFGPGAVEAISYGNVLTNLAFLHGLSVAELTDAEFDSHDPYYPSVIGVRAVRSPLLGPPVVSGFSRTNSVAPGFSRTNSVAPGFSRTNSVASGFSRTQHVRGAILLYHRVDDRPDAYGMNVPVAAFEADMTWLKNECHALPLDQLLSTPAEQLPERAVALTFDDGYVDNLHVAAPVLERLGLPATFFLTTRWLDEPGEYWWDLLERVLLGDVAVPPELPIAIDGRAEPLRTRTPDERRVVHRRLHDLMVHATLRQRDELVRALHAWASPGPPCYRVMNGDQVRALARTEGVTIGAHTVNHLALPDQPADVWAAELRTCRADLERLLGRAVDLVAYPYGAIGSGPVATVRTSWKWGIACDERPVPASFDRARVPRIDGAARHLSATADQLGLSATTRRAFKA